MNRDREPSDQALHKAEPCDGASAVLGLFDSADALLVAIPKVREKGFGKLEAYTPYPVHGLDEALGLRRSPLGGMVMVMAALGALTALGFQYWMSAVDYPIVTGGKAVFSWQAFVPVMFEVMVLFATFTAGLGMLFLLNRLPYFGHPVLASKAIRAITRDCFALVIEWEDQSFDADAAQRALEESGAQDLETLEEPLPQPLFTAQFLLRTGTAIFATCAVSGFITYWAVKLFPVLPPMSHMQDQARLNPQKGSSFFKDEHGMQMPVPGTVARNHLPLGVSSQEEAAALINPLARNEETLNLGRKAYMDRCAVCHGPLANGVPTLSAAYGAKPANLQAAQFREYPDGKIYWAIVMGKNAMPSHAADLTEEQRWAVVHYLRALQRAQNAKDEDLK